MTEPLYWNHNTAYYKWIKRRTAACGSVLDVGCGDGSLIAYLDDGSKKLTGIDIDPSCIFRAESRNKSANTQFLCCSFDGYETRRLYDAVVFVASIHHMDMTAAIERGKQLLSPNGLLIIVGLASPSTVMDYAAEGLRIIPCNVISRLKNMQSSESRSIPVSYKLPSLSEVRGIVSRTLPHAVIKYGLYYRYLLVWRKR